MSIRVIIAGFKGKMGQAACQMVLDDSDLDLVAVLDPFESESEWQGIPVFKDKADLAGFEADVWVDFTTPTVAYENTRFALENGFAPVVGTTGFTSEEIAELKDFSCEQDLGGLIAPNFAWVLSCLCNLRRRRLNISQMWRLSSSIMTRKRMLRVEQLLKQLS